MEVNESKLKKLFPNVRLEVLRFLHQEHIRVRILHRDTVYLDLSRHLQLAASDEYDALRHFVLERKAGPVVRHQGTALHPYEKQVFAMVHGALEEEGFVVGSGTEKFHLKDDQLRRTQAEFRNVH